jgi:co-chaperonin GroES (HSP10)
MEQFELQGNRILIEKPESPESLVTLTDSAKAEQEKEQMLKWSKLTVVAAGNTCNRVKAGDLVYVGKALEHSEVLVLDEKVYFLLNEGAVAMIWK